MKRMMAEEFNQRMRQIASNFGEDNTTALESCDLVLEEGIRQNFDESETARGEPWPLRKDPEPKHPLLILEGSLKAAAMYTRGKIADGKTLTRQLQQGPTGTSRAGIRRHEFGDEEVLGREGILARPYYGVSSEAADRCADTVADHLAEQVMQGLA